MGTAVAFLVLVSIAVGCGGRATFSATGSWPSRASTSGVATPKPPGVRLPDAVRPIRYALDLTIVPKAPDFQGRIAIDAVVKEPVSIVWLNANGLDVAEAKLNGQLAGVARPHEDVIGLTIGSSIAPGPLSIELTYAGPIDREKSRGIYAEREGDAWYAYTFFEAIDARRAFPCFDQPDAKVPWRLTLHVEKDHVALANAPVETTTDESDGMKRVVIATLAS